MNKREAKVCQKKLIEAKRTIQGKLFGENTSSLGINQKDSRGDLSGVPLHLADIGSDNYDRDFNLDLAQGQSSILQEIDVALEKIRQNSYGVCENCKNTIASDPDYIMHR